MQCVRSLGREACHQSVKAKASELTCSEQAAGAVHPFL